MRYSILQWALLGVIVVGTSSLVAAQSTKSPALPADKAKQRTELVQRGVEYLSKHGQAEDGTFSLQAGPGVTALVLTSMLRNDIQLDHPALQKGLKALEGFVKPDGGIYGNGRLKNYETCVSVLCFSEANKVAKDGRYNKLLKDAQAYLKSLQVADAEVPEYGGVGYAGKGRPDLSNTAYLLEALQALDTSANDPAVQRALIFVSRCQNLKSEHNDNPLVAKVNDGGFFYTLPNEKDLESSDRNAIVGGLRSYGSMTYSGLKSMIYAGLGKDDKRVQAATQWLSKHYTLAENPGMGKAGLFYYFHTFAAALQATGKNEFQDNEGKTHAWKVELIDALAALQGSDGAWKNDNRQWFEDDKNLATAFALMALGYCAK
ncbi:MAG: prenyltransferase/squalene oxidase repeat-containing protein [Pirellulales bacterium]